jgi:hypothetical protein
MTLPIRASYRAARGSPTLRGWTCVDQLGALTLTLLLICNACGVLEPSRSTLQSADQFYIRVQSEDYDAILGTCSAEFLGETPAPELVSNLKRQHVEFGSLRRCARLSAGSTHYVSPDRQGTRTTLEFACTYDRVETSETLTLDDANNGEGPKVRGYHVEVRHGGQARQSP